MPPLIKPAPRSPFSRKPVTAYCRFPDDGRRGLPGIERGDRGEGRIVGHVCVLVEGRGEAVAPLLDARSRLFGGSVVRDDDLERSHRLPAESGKHALEPAGGVVGRYDDRE